MDVSRRNDRSFGGMSSRAEAGSGDKDACSRDVVC
jgi:hypothetical protein